MPRDDEAIARVFYTGQLGVRTLKGPECVDLRGSLSFDAGGLALHLSVEEQHMRPDTQRHFGLGCGNVDELRARLKATGVVSEDGPPVPGSAFLSAILLAIVSKFTHREDCACEGLRHDIYRLCQGGCVFRV